MPGGLGRDGSTTRLLALALSASAHCLREAPPPPVEFKIEAEDEAASEFVDLGIKVRGKHGGRHPGAFGGVRRAR
jgi:hypothetical protein